MHPAPSLIVFTVLSGFGFGLMAWVGAGFGGIGLGLLAMLLATGGLLASLLHLHQPQRAWRALSQWRSSWLSREGVAALVALTLFALHGALWLRSGERPVILGALAALAAFTTVGATAMIYAQLRTVARWYTPLTPILFLAHALAGGALLAAPPAVAAGLLLVTGAVLILHGNRTDPAPDLASATGLGGRGAVRAFEPPQTGGGYLLSEMAFRVGRARAGALRRLALGAGVVLPAALVLALPAPTGAGLAAAFHLIGAAAGRWLFFAEARHVVSGYFPERSIAAANR